MAPESTNTYIAAEVRQIIESGGPTTERPLAEEVHRRMTDNPAVKVLSVPHLRRKIRAVFKFGGAKNPTGV